MQQFLPYAKKQFVYYSCILNTTLKQKKNEKFKAVFYRIIPVFFILCAFVFSQKTIAQTASQYTFSTLATASLAADLNGNTIDMTTGTTQLVAASQDDGVSAITNIGFTFTFMSTGGTNNVFTQFSASSNGVMRLGSTAVSSSLYGNAFPVTSQAIIAPYLQDQETNTTGKVHYKLFGTYPNRTLVVEFLNMRINYNSTSADGTYQVRLYEQSNIIEFVYGSMAVGSVSTTGASSTAAARNVSIGFSNTTGTNNNFTVNQSTYATNTGSAPIQNTNSATGNIAGLNSSANGSRRSFTFVPTVAYKSQFISMSTGSTTWCTGETRNVTVTIKNIGTATWTTSSPVINIGAKFNANSDYDYRLSANNLAPGAQATFTIPITAPATASTTENISFDIVKETLCWFRDNIAGCAGPGNMNFVSVATQTIVAAPQGSLTGSTICTGGTGQLTFTATAGTGPFTVVYNDGVANRTATGVTSGVAFNAFNNPTSTTSYTLVSVTNAATANSCVTSSGFTGSTATITINTRPTGAINSANTTMCSGGSTNITGNVTATGAWTLTLSNSGGTVTGTGNSGFTKSVSPTANTTYTIASLVDSKCTSIAADLTGSTTVTVNALPTAAISYSGTPFCSTVTSASPTVTGTSGGSFSSVSGLSINTSTGVINPSASTAGTYTVIYNFSNGTCPNSTTTSVTINTAPSISSSPADQIACKGGSSVSFSVTASGTTPSYQWQYSSDGTNFTNSTNGTAGGFTFAGATTATETITAGTTAAAGHYYIRCIVTVSGCSSVISDAADYIVQASVSGLAYTTTTPSYCTNTAIAADNVSTITGGGTITYSVSPALPTGLSLNTSTGAITGTPTGAPSATTNVVTATNGCSSTTATLSIRVNSLPSVLLGTSTSSLCQGSSAVLTATNSGGTASVSGSNTTDVAISSSGTPTITSTITLPSTSISSASLLSLSIDITHTYTGDLTVTLISPSCGQSIIFDQVGSSKNLSGVYVFTPTSSTTFPGAYTGNNNTNAVYNPGTYNATFSGITFPCLNAGGTWTLQIKDNASGDGGTLNGWSLSVNGGNYSTVFNGPATIGAVSYSGTGNSTATASVTPPVGSNSYTAITTDGSGCQATSSAVAVTVNPTSVAGNISGAATVCSGTNSTTLTLSGNTGTIQWQSSPDNTTFTNISGATSSTYTATNLTATTYYRAVVTSGVCTSATTSSVTIIVNATSVAGSISGAATVCSGTNSTTLTLSGNTGTIQWQSSPNNTTFTNISGATSSSYTATNLTATTYYRAVVTSGVCTSATTSSVVITINPTSVAGSISGAATVCSGTNSTTLTLSGNTGTIQWQSSPNNTTFTNISGATSSTYTAINLTATTYYRAVVTSGVCSSATTSSVTVTVNPLPTATISGTTSVCQNSASPNVTFTGANGTAPYTFTYKINGGSNQTVTTISGNSVTVAAPTTTAGTYTYSLVSVSGQLCSQAQSGTATITVNPLPTATISGTTTVCQNSASPDITFTGANGTAPYTFTYKINGGSNQTVTTISGNSVTVAVSTTTAGTYTYTLVSVSGQNCSQSQSGTATVTVNPQPTATISGTTSVCQNLASPNVTFTGANGTAPYTFTYKINGGSNQTVTTISGNSVTVAAPTTTAGTYTYSLVSVSGQLCSQAQSGTATITVNPLPTATISGTTTVCQNSASPDITFTGANGTAPYTFTYKINGGSNQTVTTISGNSVTVAVSTTTAGTYTYTLVSVSGQNCSQSQSGTATVTVNPTVTAGIVSGTSPLCIGATATYSSTGTAGGTWSSTNTGVATVNATSGLVTAIGAGMTDITYTVSSGCGSPVSAFKTLTVNTNTWTGVTSSAWDVASNWTCGVPTATSDVIIPTGAPMYPVVPSSGSPYSVRNVTIESGASLTTEAQSGSNQGILNISGTFSNSGTLSNSGKIILSGSVAQDFPGSASAIINPMNELEVNKLSGTATINKSFIINKTLIPTSGNIDLGTGNITLHSSQTYTAAVSALGTNASITYSGAGRFVIERFFPAAATRGYRLMTAPISMNGTTGHTIYTDWQNSKVYTPGIGEFITGPNNSDPSLDQNRNYSLKTYSPSTGLFVEVTHTDMPLSTTDFGTTTPANIGYLNFVRGDRNPDNLNISAQNTTTLTATGKLQTGTKIFNTPANSNSFILIGNPYASPANFGTLAKSNVSNQFWAYDARLNGGGYVNLSESSPGSGVYTQTPTTTSLQTQYIQSSQAVFVQSQDNTQAASVTFTEGDKASVNTPLVFRPTTTTTSFTSNLYLVNADNTTDLADGTLSLYNDAYSNDVDYNDGAKFSNTNEMLAIKRNGSLLSVERRRPITANDTLFFSLTKSKQHSYRFEFIPDGLNGYNTAFLIDNYLKTTAPVSLSSTTTVDFTITADAASKAADRFMIVFRPAIVLPVTFTKVKAYQQGSNINVEWSIENEQNMKQYEVERSTDGRIFTNSTILTATRNNGTTATYAWPDASPVNGANYYRIKSVSKSGEIQYSSIVKVAIGSGKSLIAVYPNPITGGTINLQLTNQPAGTYNIRLLDKLGQVVIAKQSVHAEGSSTETLQVSKAMAHGTYQLEVTKPDNGKTVINVLY